MHLAQEMYIPNHYLRNCIFSKLICSKFYYVLYLNSKKKLLNCPLQYTQQQCDLTIGKKIEIFLLLPTLLGITQWSKIFEKLVIISCSPDLTMISKFQFSTNQQIDCGFVCCFIFGSSSNESVITFLELTFLNSK